MPTVRRRPAAQPERARLRARRLGAAELFAAGVHQAQGARQLEVSAQAVSLWYGRFKAVEPRPGSRSGLVRSSGRLGAVGPSMPLRVLHAAGWPARAP